MKAIHLFVFLFVSLVFISCRKEETKSAKNTFIQTIVSDYDFAAAGSLQMQDGNYLVVSCDQSNPGMVRHPGHMVKLDKDGNVIWDKRVSERNKTLWKVIAIPGTGFATFGLEDNSQTCMYLCIYNNDGNLLSDNRVNTNGSDSWVGPFDIIRLSNGNFAIAGGDESTYNIGYLKILDPSCNLVYSKVFFPPAGYLKVSFHGLCEQPDGNIALTAATRSQNNSSQNNVVLVRTTPAGNQLSYTFLEDTLYYETSNAVASFNNGLVALTSRMKGDNSTNGTYVNYTNNNNSFGPLISADINIIRFTAGGQFVNRKSIPNYPGNGMMNSIRATSDGGFILCGTVRQADSPVLVSYTKIYAVKLDSDLNVLWSKIIDTTYPAYGVDALPANDGGYLITGYQKSFNERYEMTVIKTDASGNY